MARKLVLRFRIELLHIKPVIWREIEVPSTYTFWDLHVAIQDAMGWLDYHLHLFTVRAGGDRFVFNIGIPDDEFALPDDSTLPGWEVAIDQFFTRPGDEALYLYDFGDCWYHKVQLTGLFFPKRGSKYPVCTDGKRACPPEDCGSIEGYYDVVEILKNKNHEEYEDTVYWLEHHAKNYIPYDPATFKPAEVLFADPEERWDMAFGGE